MTEQYILILFIFLQIPDTLDIRQIYNIKHFIKMIIIIPIF